MNELALFAGAGGGILGGKLLGWRTICAVEIDTYRAERLAQRQNEGFLPPFPIWNGDIANFDGRPWRGIVDVVSGGFPCQDISAANPNATGIDGERSGLWREMLRIVREVGPHYVLVENSPMLTRRGLGVVLGGLAELGMDAQWGVLGANNLGGFHIRKRIFLVGYSDREGLQRLSGNGDRNRGQEAPGHPPAAGIRVLADSGSVNGRLEHEQQVGSGEWSRKQSGGCGPNVADTDSSRELQSQRSFENERRRVSNIGPDCLWMDRELILCQDKKYRATKPGLCGMADGVADRVDRISAIGDGQVPAVVAAAWTLLSPDIKPMKNQLADTLKKGLHGGGD